MRDTSPGISNMQNGDTLRVQTEVGPGPYFVGQGFELRVSVIAGGLRPKVDPPRMANTRAWTIGTEVRPIMATGIGSVVAEENRYVFRFRVVPARAGSLEIPAIQAQLKGRSGRSQPKALLIQPLPIPGRPAEFLGGVGRFELHAEATPKVVRVGQDLEFRIKVTGPAAWGMTDRPDLGRYARLRLGLRIEPRPDETTDEPPGRTFVYRLRPTQAGEAILPPVAIAAYDPSHWHYVTQVTTGVAIRVVAVASFDPTTIHYDPPSAASRWPVRIAWAVASSATVLFSVFVVRIRKRRRLERPLASSPDRARRFAMQAARDLRIGDSQGGSPEFIGSAARQINELLTAYLRTGIGHSPGALTPEEARQGVGKLTNSDELAQASGALATRCDTILYGELTPGPDEDLCPLVDDARRLFEALGRVKSMRRRRP